MDGNGNASKIVRLVGIVASGSILLWIIDNMVLGIVIPNILYLPHSFLYFSFGFFLRDYLKKHFNR